MDNRETFLIELKYSPNDISNEKYLIIGVKELGRLLDLISVSKNYSLISITKIGKIKSSIDLIEDLIDEQRPEGLDYGCKFI